MNVKITFHTPIFFSLLLLQDLKLVCNVLHSAPMAGMIFVLSVSIVFPITPYRNTGEKLRWELPSCHFELMTLKGPRVFIINGIIDGT